MNLQENQKYLTLTLFIAVLISTFVFIKLISTYNEKTPPINISYSSPEAPFTNKTLKKVTGKTTEQKEKIIIECPENKDLQLDINTANEEDLIKLPGVGQKLAEKIIKYREQSGKFSNVNEIMNVQGIGEAKYNQILSCLLKFGHEEPLKKVSQKKINPSSTVKKGQNNMTEMKRCPRCNIGIKEHQSRDPHYKPYCPSCLYYLNYKQDKE